MCICSLFFLFLGVWMFLMNTSGKMLFSYRLLFEFFLNILKLNLFIGNCNFGIAITATFFRFIPHLMQQHILVDNSSTNFEFFGANILQSYYLVSFNIHICHITEEEKSYEQRIILFIKYFY